MARHMANDSAATDLRKRLIETAIKRLAGKGPAALQARSIAKQAKVSTMAVYSTFGGMPQMLRAVADHGIQWLQLILQ